MTVRSPYPHYDIVAKWHSPSFNDQTRDVLAERLSAPPAPRFFEAAEWAVLMALCARVLPQERANPVPIAWLIDADVAAGRGSGTRHADMPPDAEAWRRGLASLDSEAEARHGAGFSVLTAEAQDAILSDATAGGPLHGTWQVPAKTFHCDFALKAIVKIYYAHPQAMSEIGFGGPASPRGYVRLGADRFDGWEAPPGDWKNAP